MSSGVSRICATDHAALREQFLVGVRQLNLPGSRGGLQVVESRALSIQAELRATQRHRAGGNEQHLATAIAQACDVIEQRGEPAAIERALFVDKQRRADLDDQPLERGQGVVCH